MAGSIEIRHGRLWWVMGGSKSHPGVNGRARVRLVVR